MLGSGLGYINNCNQDTPSEIRAYFDPHYFDFFVLQIVSTTPIYFIRNISANATTFP